MGAAVTLARWARAVKDRDGWRCVWCGSDDRVNAHHVRPKRLYADGTLDIDNGVTLCHRCHYTAHKNGFDVTRKQSCTRNHDFCDNAVGLWAFLENKAKGGG